MMRVVSLESSLEVGRKKKSTHMHEEWHYYVTRQ
jgi:hypothetical protein